MSYFIRAVAGLFVCLTITLAMVRGIGMIQPAPSLALVFTNPDGSPCQQPCLFGIRPGLTTYDEAVILLETHPVTRRYFHHLAVDIFVDGSSLYSIKLVGSGTLVLLSLDKSQSILSVGWRLDQEQVALANRQMNIAKYSDVVLLLGNPENVLMGVGQTTLSYFGSTLSFVGLLPPQNQMSRIDLDNPVMLVTASIHYVWNVGFVGSHPAWWGFATLRRYMSGAP